MEEKVLSSLKYVVILVLLIISSFKTLCTQGRQINSLDKKQEVIVNSNGKDSLNETPNKSSLNLNHNIGEEIAASSPFTPSSNHNTVSVQRTGKEAPNKAPTSNIGYHDSAMANKNYSQPTQTGSSPGIGHHFAEDSTDQEVDIPKSLGATSGLEHSVTPSTKDLRPTQTGSSPGIGHQLVDDSANQEVDPKSLGATSGLEHSVTVSTEDFKPTVPGDVGHASKHKN